jgi:hypothetical protein
MSSTLAEGDPLGQFSRQEPAGAVQNLSRKGRRGHGSFSGDFAKVSRRQLSTRDV